MLHNGLREYATDPVDRQKERVASGMEKLRRSLNRTNKGTRWNEYLELDKLQEIAESKKRLTSADNKILRKIAIRRRRRTPSLVRMFTGYFAEADPGAPARSTTSL
jgi:hypothetical protein